MNTNSNKPNIPRPADELKKTIKNNKKQSMRLLDILLLVFSITFVYLAILGYNNFEKKKTVVDFLYPDHVAFHQTDYENDFYEIKIDSGFFEEAKQFTSLKNCFYKINIEKLDKYEHYDHRYSIETISKCKKENQNSFVIFDIFEETEENALLIPENFEISYFYSYDTFLVKKSGIKQHSKTDLLNLLDNNINIQKHIIQTKEFLKELNVNIDIENKNTKTWIE